MLVAGGRRNAVVANQGLGEDENLATIGRIGHGLGVTNKRGGEYCLAGNIGFGAKGLAGEDRAVLESGELN